MTRPIQAVLWDLGGTLADYYDRAEWPAVLTECIGAGLAFMGDRGLPLADPAVVRAALEAEQVEESRRLKGGDWRVYPMEDRLQRAYLPAGASADAEGLCRAFLGPIFARGRLVPGAHEAVDALKGRGVPMAIVSNMPWGAPRRPWEEEVRRLGLLERVSLFLTCRDSGWRKPDTRIFTLAAERLGVAPADCLFVGDEAVWDFEGALAAGMQPVLLDRDGRHTARGLRSIRTLEELPGLV